MKSKKTILLSMLIFVVGCGSSGIENARNDINKKVDKYLTYEKYGIYNEEEKEEFISIKNNIDKYDQKKVDEVYTNLQKIELNANEVIKGKITSEFNIFSSAMLGENNYNYASIKNKFKYLSENSVNNLNKLIIFFEKYKTDIVDKEACTMFNESFETCSNFENSINIYISLYDYREKYSMYVTENLLNHKKILEEQAKEEAANQNNPDSSNPNTNNPKTNNNQDKQVDDTQTTPSTSQYKVIFNSYEEAKAELRRLGKSGIGARINQLPDGRFGLIY